MHMMAGKVSIAQAAANRNRHMLEYRLLRGYTGALM
jgi:hypothetical protein